MTADTPPDDEIETSSDRSAAATGGDLERRERAMRDRGEPYARATVVRREPPISANVGDHALVTTDGDLHGWIGGVACAQSRVVSEARAAIADGEPRLIGLAPDPNAVDRPGLEAFPMTCHSEGTLEIFVEPVTSATRLLVVGGSPIARSLARLAPELAVDVTVVDPDAARADLPEGTTVLSTLEPDEIADAVGTNPFVVVASMGEFDARGVAAGMLADSPYIGLVASRARVDEVVERAAGLTGRDPEVVRKAVTNPAGVDISATTGPEIAASLLAELVDVRTELGTVTAAVGDSSDGPDDETVDTDGELDGSVDESAGSSEPPAIDPVCGMTVESDDAPTVTHEGTTYSFCCPSCADSFRTDPDEYLEATEDGAVGSV